MPEATRRHDARQPQLPRQAAGPLSVSADTQRARSSASSGRAQSVERRDVTARQRLLRRITLEYVEMPGLCLTTAQAERLFCLGDDVCRRVLQELVDGAILRRDVNGVYWRDVGKP